MSTYVETDRERADRLERELQQAREELARIKQQFDEHTRSCRVAATATKKLFLGASVAKFRKGV